MITAQNSSFITQHSKFFTTTFRVFWKLLIVFNLNRDKFAAIFIRPMKLTYRISIVALAFGLGFTSCKKDETSPETTTPASAFRAPLAYSAINDTLPYVNLFVTSTGDTTVDLSEGNTRLNIFKAIDAYCKLPNPVGSTTMVDATVLKNMFASVGSPFTGSYAFLNGTTLQMRNTTSLTAMNPEGGRLEIETFFEKLAAASQSVSDSAYQGNAGKLGSRLYDENGIEWCQVISKSLMGAHQLDYIGNTLLSNSSLENADNSKLVAGKKYTELEHIWDEAYACLTLNNRIYKNLATNSGETLIASYIWEYNKEDFPNLHHMFMEGRVAINNNDITKVKEQANKIRRAMEKALAKAAIGYMGKAKDANTNTGAHALAEGLGFVYSLRFCTLNGGTDMFSEDQLEILHFYGQGYWAITPADLDQVVTNINTKFGF